MTDTEHNVTFSSNDEEEDNVELKIKYIFSCWCCFSYQRFRSGQMSMQEKTHDQDRWIRKVGW